MGGLFGKGVAEGTKESGHLSWCNAHALRVCNPEDGGLPAVPSRKDFDLHVDAIKLLFTANRFPCFVRKRLRMCFKVQKWFRFHFQRKKEQVAKWVEDWTVYEAAFYKKKKLEIGDIANKISKESNREKLKRLHLARTELYNEYMRPEVPPDIKTKVVKAARSAIVKEKIELRRFLPTLDLSVSLTLKDIMKHLSNFHHTSIGDIANIKVKLTFKTLSRAVFRLLVLQKAITLPWTHDLRARVVLDQRTKVAALMLTAPASVSYQPLSELFPVASRLSLVDNTPNAVYGEEEAEVEKQVNATADQITRVQDAMRDTNNPTIVKIIRHLVIEGSARRNSAETLTSQLTVTTHEAEKLKSWDLANKVVGALEHGVDIRRYKRHIISLSAVTLAACIVCQIPSTVFSTKTVNTIFAVAKLRGWAARHQVSHSLSTVVVLLGAVVCSRAAFIEAQPITKKNKMRRRVEVELQRTRHSPCLSPAHPPEPPPKGRWRLPDAPPPAPPPPIPETEPSPDVAVAEFDSYFDALCKTPLPKGPAAGVIVPIKPVSYKRCAKKKATEVSFAQASSKDDSFWYWWHKGNEEKELQRRDTKGRQHFEIKPPPCGRVLASFVPYAPPLPLPAKRALTRHCKLHASVVEKDRPSTQMWSKDTRNKWIQAHCGRVLSPEGES